MTKSNYKFTYFNVTARGENTRMLFALADVVFQDVRLTGDEWAKLKPKTTFGQLPILEVDGTMICQSKAIERLLAKRFGLYGNTDLEQAKADMVIDCLEEMRKPLIEMVFAPEEKKPELRKAFEQEKGPKMLANLDKMVNSNGHFIGKKISWPDVDCFNVISFAKHPSGVNLTPILNKHAKLQGLLKNVEKNPKIAEWLAKRPKAQF